MGASVLEINSFILLDGQKPGKLIIPQLEEFITKQKIY
jgi:hypothetical protein